MPIQPFRPDSFLAATAWGPNSDEVFLYGQAENDEIHELKGSSSHDWHFNSTVGKACPNSPIAVACNRKDWIRVLYVGKDEKIREAAFDADSNAWVEKTIDIKPFQFEEHRTPIAAWYEGDGKYRIYAEEWARTAEEFINVDGAWKRSGHSLHHSSRSGRFAVTPAGLFRALTHKDYVERDTNDRLDWADWREYDRLKPIIGEGKNPPSAIVIPHQRQDNGDFKIQGAVLPANGNNLFLAMVHSDSPDQQDRGLHYFIASDGVITERYYTYKGWKEGLWKDVAVGPIAAATSGKSRVVFAYAHDKKDPTVLREWYNDGGWTSRKICEP